MSYQKEYDAICLGDTKQTALFFDNIFPLSLTAISFVEDPKFKSLAEKYKNSLLDKAIPKEIIDCFVKEGVQLGKILNSLYGRWQSKISEIDFPKKIPNEIKELIHVFHIATFKDMDLKSNKEIEEYLSDSFYEMSNESEDYLTQLIIRARNEKIDYSQGCSNLLEALAAFYIEDIRFKKHSNSFRELIKFLKDELQQTYATTASVILPASYLTYYTPTENDLTLSMGNINLVDTEKAEWDQIIEFRKDEEARKKLRNFRLFFHTNYQGKGQAYIEDDLNKRLDDYSSTCKEWGFKTITSIISTVMDSKSLQASIATSWAGVFLGEPVLTAGAILSGTSIEIGKISLEIAKRKHAFQKLKKDHDLAYIIETKEKLE